MNQKGTALVTLLVFVAIALLAIGGAITVTVINTQLSSEYTQGENTFFIAEAGVEEALIRLVRDPNYTGGSLTVGNGTATISVTGTTTKTITSEGSFDNNKRKVEVQTTFTNGSWEIDSWKEIE